MSWFTDIFKPSKPPDECLIFCVPQSLSCAWAWTIKYRQEVRIAVMNLRNGVDHAQAQCLDDGEWKPLVMFWTKQGPVVRIGHPHFDVEPYRYLTLPEWIAEQLPYTKLN